MKGIQPSSHLNGSFTHLNGWFGWMRSKLLNQISHSVCISVKPLNGSELIDNHEIVVFDTIITDHRFWIVAINQQNDLIIELNKTLFESNQLNRISIFVFTLFIIFCIIINSRDINCHRLRFNTKPLPLASLVKFVFLFFSFNRMKYMYHYIMQSFGILTWEYDVCRIVAASWLSSRLDSLWLSCNLFVEHVRLKPTFCVVCRWCFFLDLFLKYIMKQSTSSILSTHPPTSIAQP